MEKIKDLYNEIYGFGQLCKKNHLDSHSAAAAFFMFVSIIPFIILLLAIVPFTPLTDSSILNIAETILPERLDYFAVDIMRQLTDQSIAVLSISALGAMWAASRALLTIKQGLNEIRGVVETRNFILLRINAAFYTIGLIVSFVLMLTLNVVFTAIERYFRDVLGISIFEHYDFAYLVVTLRPIITILITFLINLYFFIFLPNHKVTAKSQIPGAILVALIWYIFTTLFGLYINYYNAYSMYGSLSVVIIILFWLYACMYILFLGGQFNYYLSLMRENNKI
ncbi:MAG: YihY/virulence factor BrkB family protein [Lachnospiraceae bacterium]|nr:YihY/virulence factor BrkB family protein [Lachnospiraceae bacterium]